MFIERGVIHMNISGFTLEVDLDVVDGTEVFALDECQAVRAVHVSALDLRAWRVAPVSPVQIPDIKHMGFINLYSNKQALHYTIFVVRYETTRSHR